MGKNKEYELAIKIAGEVEKSFYESTKLTKKELRDIAKQAALSAQAAQAVPREASEHMMFIKDIFSQKNMREIEPFFNGLENAAVKSFKAISAAAVASGAMISSGLAASVNIGSDFEEQMSAVQAISMSDNSDMVRLNNMAKELGKSTKFSAAEVGQGFEYMAMAGWKTEDMLNGINGVLNLAAASGEDLGEVSDIVTDAMTAFGLGAEQAGHFADVLAIASSNSNTNVSMMGETFKYVAPVAGTLGYSIEDTAAAIGLMANSGIKASQAGTSLRSIFSRLAAPTKEVQGAMDALGLSLTDEDGKMKSFLKLTQDIRAGFAGMSEIQQSEVASKLAGQEALSGLLAIANAPDEDFRKLTEAINESTGAAEKMAEIRLDNLKGDITILRSATEGFGIDLYENFNGPLRNIVQTGTEFIGDMTNEINAKYPTARRKVLDFAESMKELQEPLLNVGGWLLDNPGAITGPVMGLGAALGTYKIASGISSITKALGAMNPAGMAILGIGGVVGVIKGIGAATKKAAEDAKQANLAAHFGDISLSLAELQETAAFVVQSEGLTKVRESVAAMRELDGISDDIRNAVAELNRKNWKVSIGMGLTELEIEEYQGQIDSFVQSVQEYVTQRQYAINLSLDVHLDDEPGLNGMKEDIQKYYSGKQQEISTAKAKMDKAVELAREDGNISPEESEEIAKLQEEIYQIQQDMQGSEYDSGLDAIKLQYGNERMLTPESAMNLMAEIRELTSTALLEQDEDYRNILEDARLLQEDGIWNQDKYDETEAFVKSSRLQDERELLIKGASFYNDLIREAYGEEWESMARELQEQIQDNGENQILDTLRDAAYSVSVNLMPNIDWELLSANIINSTGIDKSTRDAMAELFEQSKPEMERMLEEERGYIDRGEHIPAELREAIIDTATIGALGGDMDAIWTMLGRTVNSQEYATLIGTMKESGGYVPEAFINGIGEKQWMLNEAVIQSAQETLNVYRKAFGEGIAVSVPVKIMQTQIDVVNSALASAVPHADGGIFDKPHLGWVAEAGYPESIIPLNGSKEAMDLWLKTGELLGMDGLTGGPEPLADDIAELAYSGGGETVLQIENSPVIYFYGNAPDKEEIEGILEDENEKFARMMETYLSNNRRTRFYD